MIESIDAEIDAWFRAGSLDNDTRSRDQLRADAHLEIIKRGALANTSHHGPRPLIVAHIRLPDLFDRAGTATTEDRIARRADILNGGPVAAATVRDLLCDADLAVTITDDDATTVDVPASVVVTEGAGVVATITATLERASAETVTV